MNARRVVAASLVAFVALLMRSDRARPYATLGTTWPDGNVVMQLQLGSINGTLIDGYTSWGASAESGLALWNPYLDRVTFRVVRDSTASIQDGNGINNVFWSSSVFGRPFPQGTYGTALAVTTRWSRGSTRTEADIIFNNSYSWNSYRGPLKSGTVTSRVYDFHRVAIHEEGHVLGLDHPDEHGQQVTAIMNANTSDLDHIASDDISGVQSLYSVGGNGTVSFPARNESLDFRSQLENKYRNGLKRALQSSYVDNEGDIVWTSEYFRYRVNQCSHDAAVFKVMSEIDTGATLGVCGSAPAGTVNFPPRNEALDFRNQLEAKYRDDLRRGPNLTAVDNEGDVVWTQEYLRYRVNGCSHGDAVQRVFLQIDGNGVQPVCR